MAVVTTEFAGEPALAAPIRERATRVVKRYCPPDSLDDTLLMLGLPEPLPMRSYTRPGKGKKKTGKPLRSGRK